MELGSVRDSVYHLPPERTPSPARWPHLTERQLVVMLFALAAHGTGTSRLVDELRREIRQRGQIEWEGRR